MFTYYASLVGDAPYPSFTLAAIESDRPGGHSPPYFALLNQVVVGSPFVVAERSGELRQLPDVLSRPRSRAPVVGPRGRLEELPRAVDQRRVRAVFRGAVRREGSRSERAAEPPSPDAAHRDRGTQTRARSTSATAWATSAADERVFRAIIYNKAAMVLHMLRRLVGDEAFFAGVRAFYHEWKFKKAGTDDFRVAMEQASGRDLNRFFETWIYGTTIPHAEIQLRMPAPGPPSSVSSSRADPVDVPVTVTIDIPDRRHRKGRRRARRQGHGAHHPAARRRSGRSPPTPTTGRWSRLSSDARSSGFRVQGFYGL